MVMLASVAALQSHHDTMIPHKNLPGRVRTPTNTEPRP